MLKRSIGFSLFMAALLVFATTVVWAGGSKELSEVVIGNFWENWDVNTYQPTDENGEVLLEWRKRAIREHGMTIRERMVADWGGMLQTITTSVMAGRPAAQVFHVTPDWAMALMRQRLLAPISDNTVVDLTTNTAIPFQQVQWNQDINELFRFGGKIYAIVNGYGGSRHSAGIFFNKRLFAEAGLDPDLPYDMQRNNTWTWDNFFEIAKTLTRDRNNTGRIDVFAMHEDTANGILEAFVFSNGAGYVERVDGQLVNATSRPEFIEAMNFCRRLRAEGVMMERGDGAWDSYFSMFHDGHIAMMIDPEWRVSSIANMADDWGYVLPPRGPRMAKIRFPQDENVFVVPSTYSGEDLNKIVKALELWVTPTNDDWRAGLWSSFRDRRAVEETMAMVFSPDYNAFRTHMLVPGLEPGDIAWQMWWWDGDPAQLVEMVSPSWDALIRDANNIR